MLKGTLETILLHLSKGILARYRPTVIGVTGSVGKSSTRDAIALVLRKNFLMRASTKSYNNEIGVPLTIIGARTRGRSVIGWFEVFIKAIRLLIWYSPRYPWMLVLEMGADRPGNIAYLTALAPCSVAVLTNVGTAHLENYGGDQNALFAEKIKIFESLGEQGWAIANVDDESITGYLSHLHCRSITYGFSSTADVRVLSHEPTLRFTKGIATAGVIAKIRFHGAQEEVFLDGVLGKPPLYAVMASIAVASIYDISLRDACVALREYQQPTGRMKILDGIKHTLLIDDTYNASPLAMREALSTLGGFAVDKGSRKIAVLGDMLELGGGSEEAHRAMGALCAEGGVDMIIAVGERAHGYIEGATAVGFDKKAVLWFDTSTSAHKEVQALMKEGDVLLIKGSQGMRMEYIVKEVMAEPERAGELLCRQSAEWQH